MGNNGHVLMSTKEVVDSLGHVYSIPPKKRSEIEERIKEILRLVESDPRGFNNITSQNLLKAAAYLAVEDTTELRIPKDKFAADVKSPEKTLRPAIILLRTISPKRSGPTT